jgi:hypothetical protein
MKVLPKVLLVLTVIALGVMYGGYRFKLDRGEAAGGFTIFIRNTLKDMGNKLAGDSQKTELQTRRDDVSKRPQEAGFGKGPASEAPPSTLKWTYEPKSGKTPASPPQRPPKKSELDRIDLLMKEASAYLNVATLHVELRNEYAQKAYDCTTKALNIFESFSEETQNRPEFEERLKAITMARHAAIKLAPMEE